jgi:probable rRNA maturation factor
MIKPGITLRNFQKKIPIHPKRIKKTVLKIFSLAEVRRKFCAGAQVTICFVDDKTIKKLNREYLHKNTPTDVLVFEGDVAADIVISTDTASRNSKIFKTTPLYEIFLYITHGVLHLIGYHDRTAKQKGKMRKRQTDILAKLKITNQTAKTNITGKRSRFSKGIRVKL